MNLPEKESNEKINHSEVLLKADLAEASLAAAELFVTAAKASVERSGLFTVALSGGSTPGVLYRMLAEKPFAQRIPWDKTHVFWVDERCVPAEDPSSNYGAASKDLFVRIPIPPENVHQMPGSLPPDEGARTYQEMLVRFFSLQEGQFPVFDLILLGVGKDGHTASLFPGQPALKDSGRMVVHVIGGDPFLDRITLTLPVLNRGRRIVFLAAGNGKAEILRSIFSGERGDLPACRIRPVTGSLLWILDLRAAALLA
ncbi:MAG: 6-phosphogluconolactonase [Desulfatiglandales bacterium]